MFVAVVYNAEYGFTSRREAGDYSCFLADTEADAVEKAMTHKRKWDGYKHDDGSITYYKIVVGKINQIVSAPAYELEDFDGEYSF